MGFIFENKPSVSAHVAYSINKYNRALWALNHLKCANIDVVTLLEVFKVMLRPILEYCPPVYHYMLTISLSNDIERQQKCALKIIYGFDQSYETLLERTGLKTLKQRRIEACDIFANKLVNSRRFAHLFPETIYDANTPELRRRKKYQEQFARTERMYKSPLFSMRTRLNETT